MLLTAKEAKSISDNHERVSARKEICTAIEKAAYNGSNTIIINAKVMTKADYEEALTQNGYTLQYHHWYIDGSVHKQLYGKELEEQYREADFVIVSW